MFASRIRSSLQRKITFQNCTKVQRAWNRNSTKELGECCCEETPSKPPLQDKHSWKTYRAVTLFVALPTILIMSAVQWKNHASSHTECEERPEFIAYPYLRIRTKKFPWGDGDKSLLHNPRVNALPSGYEDNAKTNDENTTKDTE